MSALLKFSEKNNSELLLIKTAMLKNKTIREQNG
jgi:hypothetical protein